MSFSTLVRLLLTAACGLVVGFVAARAVLSIAEATHAGDPPLRMIAAYVAWLLVALVTVLLVRRLLPADANDRGRSA